MAGESADTEIRKQILRSLREFYPIKVDEIVLISAVQKNVKDASIEQISKDIRSLRDSGWIEESVVKAPFGKTETYRFKITSQGIEHLQGLEEHEGKSGAAIARDMESRLVETYDRIKSDMETMRLNLEASQKTISADMVEMGKRIADHDNVIRTYFVRVIETFGVFVGIFAVVVVAMLGTLQTAIGAGTLESKLIVLVAAPVILVSVILTLLYGIRVLVLKPPKAD